MILNMSVRIRCRAGLLREFFSFGVTTYKYRIDTYPVRRRLNDNTHDSQHLT